MSLSTQGMSDKTQRGLVPMLRRNATKDKITRWDMLLILVAICMAFIVGFGIYVWLDLLTWYGLPE